MIIGATITYRRPSDATDQTGVVIVAETITDHYTYFGVTLPVLSVGGLITLGTPLLIQYGACVVKGVSDNNVRVVAYRDVKTVINIQPDLPSTTVNVAAPTVNNNVPVPTVNINNTVPASAVNVSSTAPVVNVSSSPATVNVSAVAPIVNNTVPVPTVNVEVNPADNENVINVSPTPITVNNNIEPMNIDPLWDSMSTMGGMLGKRITYTRYYQNSSMEDGNIGEGVVIDKVSANQYLYYKTKYNMPLDIKAHLGSNNLEAYVVRSDEGMVEVIPCMNILSVIGE